MPEKAIKLSKGLSNVWLSGPLAIALAVFIWAVSASWTAVQGKIVDHEKRIVTVEQKIDTVVSGVQRLEVKMGTLPPQEKK